MRKNVKRMVRFLTGLLVAVLLAVPVYAAEDFTILKLEQRGANYVFLEWDEYADADGYSLYRCEDAEAYGLIKHVTSCSTYNYALENGKTYYYIVRPYRVLDGGRKQYLATSKSVSIQIGVKMPANLAASVHGKSSVTVRWEGDPLAGYYLLYRSTDNCQWTLVKRVYGVSTTTYGLNEGETYYFRVKAVRNINGVERYSDYSESAECTLGVLAPDHLTVAKANRNSVELEWESVQNASGYRLYRAENSGEYRLIKTVTGTTTRNYNLSPDITYTYRIAAIMEGDSHTYKSEYTYAEPIRLSLSPVKNLHIEKYFSNGVSLCWDSVEGATGYRLYRTGEDGITTLVKTISESRTNTYSLIKGQCYSFSIKPICESGEVTVNGSETDDVSVFFTALPSLTITQQEVNKICLTWDAVTGAEKFELNILQGERAETLEFTGSDAEHELYGPDETSVSLWAVRNGVKSIGVNETFVPVYEDALSFSVLKAINDSGVSIAWEPRDGAVQYEVQRLNEQENEFATVGISANTSMTDNTVSPNTEYQYRYRVKYSKGDSLFWGNWSEPVCVKTPGAPRYRALLIGEENYETILHGPVNDIEAMNYMLSGMTAMKWDIFLQADATRDEIVGLISLAFADATENDVSLFYYSGHGVTGSGDYYSGALMTVDYSYIPMQDLAEMLSAVPGKVIVILDSCGSGAAISGETTSAAVCLGDDLSSFDPAVFNTQTVQIFSLYSEREQVKSAELATDKFCVLTSSAYEQNSRSVCIDNVWGGAFTRAFVGCAGYDYNSKIWSEKMHADENADDCLTLNECYKYCYNEALEYQNVQVYPLDSSVKLLYK